MDSLARELLEGKRPDLANSCPDLKALIEDTKQGRVSFSEFVNILRESKKAAEMAEVI